MPSVLHLVGRTNDDGAGYKAALLSGPPGIGKTTTAQIVCQVCVFISLVLLVLVVRLICSSVCDVVGTE